jgi:hypothetical protein
MLTVHDAQDATLAERPAMLLFALSLKRALIQSTIVGIVYCMNICDVTSCMMQKTAAITST